MKYIRPALAALALMMTLGSSDVPAQRGRGGRGTTGTDDLLHNQHCQG